MESRIIKFRAWDLDAADKMYSWEEIQKQFIEHVNHNRVVVMQFTGLTDKDSKEIYEGDILRLEFESLKMDGYVMQKDCGEWIFYKDEGNFLGVHHNKDRVTIIGNIYENPDLLNPQNQ